MMLKSVPIQAWLLILIGLFAYPLVTYVYRYVMTSPDRNEVGAPPSENFEGRDSRRLAICLVALLALGCFAIFIFTPAAAEFARSPSFWSLLVAAFSLFAFYQVVDGLRKGQIEPIVRGNFGPYLRMDHPKRYWASVVWNAVFALLCAFLAFKI